MARGAGGPRAERVLNVREQRLPEPDPMQATPESGSSAPDRGGPFGRRTGVGHPRRLAPGAVSDPDYPPAAESSPIGGESRTRIALSWLLAAASAATIVAAVAVLAKAHVGQALLEVAWKRAQSTGTAPAPWPWADTHPVAKLYAPAQDAELLLLAGASGRTLAWGPGHLDGTARPGERGNAVVSAHRDTHFHFLAHASIGDPLVVERPDGVRVTYRIATTRIADASRLAIPRDADVPTLTLVTCWPFDAIVPGGPLRYVVVAQADGEPAQRLTTAASERR